MRIASIILRGVILGALWNTQSVLSVVLTTTLITGLMGGFLIGRMNLGTFLGLLSTNGTNLPSLNLPTLPSLIPRDEDKQKSVSNSVNIPLVYPVMSQLVSPLYTYSNFPAAPLTYYYGGAAPATSYPQQMSASSSNAQSQSSVLPQSDLSPPSQSQVDFSIIPIKPMDVPVSLDHKIRERFIQQLTLMDPLNCLPKLFCEASADPYGTALALDHGTIAAIQPSSSSAQHQISLKEVDAYEMHLHKQTSTTTTTTTTAKPTKLSDVGEDKSDSSDEDDGDSAAEDGSDSEEDDLDDSFEQYKKEDDHKLEMQAFEEMADEIDDPTTYLYLLRDKKKKKEKMKKYREKHKQQNEEDNDYISDDFQGNPAFREEETGFSNIPSYIETGDHYLQNDHQYEHENPSFYANRRLGANGPLQPLSPPQPPRPPLFMSSMLMGGTTENPLTDMFADDPFFDEFTGGSSRTSRQFLHLTRNRIAKNVEKDLMKQYRVAYKVAEKYRSPDMCKVAFPSCPYQTKTILNVVNRLESGLLPFNLKKADVTFNRNGNKNNIDHFKNTLLAIERLNKATLQAQSRGEPLDLDKLMEVAASPTVVIDANTSKNIVKEFQQVVSKIKTAKLKKTKLKTKKNKKKRKNYDAVHYYKKAQMESLKPKQKATTKNPLDPYRPKSEDDEIAAQQTQIRRKWEHVPTFKETYADMFKASKVKVKPKPTFPTTQPPLIFTIVKKGNHGIKGKITISTTTLKPIRKFSEVDEEEDDEQDAKDSEEAINMLISRVKPNRSPII